MFVAPGTIAALLARGDAGTCESRRSRRCVVSNRGGVEAGAKLSDTVSRALASRLGALKYDINQEKVGVLDRANSNGSQLAQIYSSLGTFGVLAGILLLVNIFFMLADERKSELGMLRAVGLRRSALVGAFAAEGWCYAIVAAVAGTFVGLGLGRADHGVRGQAAETAGRRAHRLALHFAFTWASVQRGLVIGFVIALATVLITSVWLSRFNIIRAIRDITETPPHRPHAALVLRRAGAGRGRPAPHRSRRHRRVVRRRRDRPGAGVCGNRSGAGAELPAPDRHDDAGGPRARSGA